MKIELKNISRKKGLELLSNVQKNQIRGFAIQGKEFYETIYDNTITASISPIYYCEETDSYIHHAEIDYTRCNFVIQSGYWSETVLKQIAEIE